MRVDIKASLDVIESKLLEKKELLKNFLIIETKISEILRHDREDDVLTLISDETDVLEILNLVEYDIFSEKDYIYSKTGKRFEEITGKNFPQFAEFEKKIKIISSESKEIISQLNQLKAENMKKMETKSEDLKKQVRELELMNNLNIITPKDLQQL